MMIAAIFEVCLKADRKRHYLKIAADLKPLLEKVTMSALPLKADMCSALANVPIADIHKTACGWKSHWTWVQSLRSALVT